MTAPLTSTPAVTPPPPPPPPPPLTPVQFPLDWLLEHAGPSIKYRSITEVARLPVTDPKLSLLPFSHLPALRLAMMQAVNGTWNNSMLGTPSSRAENFEGVGTINAFRRMVEYGWDRESPTLVHARRVLFRLLAEDEDPQHLFELLPKGKTPDVIMARRNRSLLREAAAAALAHAGYESDPRLRGAARRISERVYDYLRSPLAEKPFKRIGNQHVLPQEAAPPSMYSLTMLAYMPSFRSEHHEILDRIYIWLNHTMPRQEVVQECGGKILPQPHLVLGDPLPHRNAADADVPAAIVWLELMARLGFLRRNENWSKLFERFLDDRDRQGIWHPHKGMAAPKSLNPYIWPMYPLEETTGGDERWADVTFRLGLIARLSGRPIELI